MVFKVINNSASLNSFVFTLLVFKDYSKIIKLNASFSLVIQKAIIIKKAIVKIYKL
jgi:hypothetical protein